MKRILVAEPNPATRRVICFNLSQAGYAVCECANCDAAYQAATYAHFDAVITERQAFGRSELIEKLRKLEGFEAVPVIVLAGNSFHLVGSMTTEEDRVASAQSRPFSPSALLTLLEGLLSEAPLAVELQ